MNYNYNFDNNKKKKKIIFVIIFCIIIIIISFIFSKISNNTVIKGVSNVIISPFNFVYKRTNNLLNNVSSNFKSKKSLLDENENLKETLKEYETLKLETKGIIDENTSLKALVDIKGIYQHFTLKYGMIIYREHDNWTQTFTVSLGEEDGIKKGQAVVHKDGLVGYVSSVNKSTCIVTTILDPITSVSVKISSVNEPAILKGDLELKSNNKLKLTYIPIGIEISIGDILYTSGFGSVYPQGIPVAKIIEVSSNKNDIDRYAVVEAIQNIRTIEEVGIIIDY